MGIETTKIPKKKKKDEQSISEPWDTVNHWRLDNVWLESQGKREERRKILEAIGAAGF